MQRCDESDADNFYECERCRLHELHKGPRLCLLEVPSAVVFDGYTAYSVDGELAAALAPRDNPIEWMQRLRTADGRELCFVPCVSAWAMDMMTRETDCREYRLKPRAGDLPAFRVIRAERSKTTLEKYKRERAEAKRGNS